MNDSTNSAPVDSDERLFLRYRDEQDEAAFERLVHRYEGELYRYLRGYLHDSDLAEDVFQATFARVSEKAHQYDPRRRFRPWIYCIAAHLAADALRQRGLARTISMDQSRGDDAASLAELVSSQIAGPEQEAAAGERESLVRAHVAALPEHLRQAVELVYFRGLKYADAARALGVPVGTVKSRIHSALHKLGRTLREAAPAAAQPPQTVPAEGSPDASRVVRTGPAATRPDVHVVHATLASLAARSSETEVPRGLARTTCLRLRESPTAHGG